MGAENIPLRTPEFQRLLARRSKWRWSLSGFLIAAYLAYAVGGVYIPDVYASPFFGYSVPWGFVVGYLIILLSIVLSLVYVRVANRLEGNDTAGPGSDG